MKEFSLSDQIDTQLCNVWTFFSWAFDNFKWAMINIYIEFRKFVDAFVMFTYLLLSVCGFSAPLRITERNGLKAREHCNHYERFR